MPLPTSLKPLAVRTAHIENESMMRRGEMVRMANATSGTSTVDDGLPPGTGGCDCDHCLEGTTIPDGTECCKSHTTWSFKNPWLTCTETDLLLHYAGGDTWISDEFTGPTGNANTYRYQLTIDVDGVLSGVPNYTYLGLVLEDDNGGDDVCLQYGRLGFDCQCDNLLTRKKPFGKVSGIAIADTSCNLCLKPEPLAQAYIESDCGSCFPGGLAPTVWEVEIGAGITNGNDGTGECLGCDGIPGTYIMGPHATYIASGTVLAANPSSCNQLEVGLTAILYCQFDTQLVLAFTGLSGGTQYQYFHVCDEPLVAGVPIIFELPGVVGDGISCDNWPATITLTPVDGLAVPDAATGSGACGDDDCTPGVVPSNPSGACCYGGYCLDFIDETLCDDFGGQWYADSADCDTSCNPTGACCVPGSGVGSGGCFNGTTAVCSAVGGTFVTGADCDDDPCVGACCRSDGSCEDGISEADCDGAGEYFWGPGTTCGTVDGCHSCCVSTLGGGSEDCVTDGDCECVYVASEAACFAYSGSDDTKAYHAAPCAARVCDCDAGSETCDNNPA